MRFVHFWVVSIFAGTLNLLYHFIMTRWWRLRLFTLRLTLFRKKRGSFMDIQSCNWIEGNLRDTRIPISIVPGHLFFDLELVKSDLSCQEMFKFNVVTQVGYIVCLLKSCQEYCLEYCQEYCLEYCQEYCQESSKIL